ncbi:hypothetical protein [Kocuria rosea]|uniref:hypothetical protein n=1 Tax=Kocuria rosea TaxID=1275 RepID=UPI000D65E7D4|nr:hypothetical protein [Kocuria rosea]PWF87548.1 hypothetical protein DEJ37_07975 [Kocuria rosea]STX02873.1 Uncharacterised protein [Kocuria rosea]
MPSPLPARRAQLLAVAALAGTTAVTGTLVAAVPAVAVPVAIAEYLVEVPEGSPSTGAESFFTPVALTNTDTAYGIHEDQPLAPVGELVLDDEGYAVAEPFDDPATGWENVVGEKVGDSPVYWEPENAALAGYILSVFGPTEDPDEALAVQWAVRSLSTAELPQPAGIEQSHLDRAEFLIQDARHNVPALAPQDGYRVSVSFEPDGRPDTLLVTMPEAYYATTVTLSGPVTFADGTTTQTFTGGDRDKYLELAVPADATGGELTADLTATMPSTELTVLADDQYRDLLIAGQERTVDWAASAGFEIDAPTAPEEVSDEETTPPDDDGTGDAPVDQDTPTGNDTDDDVDGIGGPGGDTDSGDGAAGPDAKPAVRDRGAPVLEIVTDADAEQRLTATLEAFVLFDEQTTTSTEVVTETTMTAGGAAYAESAMANTGMGAAPAAGERSAMTSAILVVVAVGAGLGAWLLRRRPATTSDRSA